MELPIIDSDEILSFGVWVSLSEQSFDEFESLLEVRDRSKYGSYFGWLSTAIATYPETLNLKTKAHLRDNFIRPYIELEPTNHPLSIEQREGVSLSRIQQVWDFYVHEEGKIKCDRTLFFREIL